ncbi:hypothetical protein FSB76_12595 [Mucilaginibacter ginsenosidivorax]|uniref:Uncharacterized protein n=1 Tax=Mucilaginibacter ginsenosidivorax TaxID=862126 RepID=A0A5B8W1N7_9SPHI|nr:hypothetical protein FSB76_12595 [Mucilaginibacter ginsenosidivorax]
MLSLLGLLLFSLLISLSGLVLLLTALLLSLLSLLFNPLITLLSGLVLLLTALLPRLFSSLLLFHLLVVWSCVWLRRPVIGLLPRRCNSTVVIYPYKLIIIAFGYLGQSCSVVAVYRSIAARTVGYTLVRVGFAVFGCIYNPRRPGVRCFFYLRPVNINGIVYNPAATIRPAIVTHSVYRHIVIVGNTSYFGNPWAGYIGAVVIYVGIVNNRSLVYNIYHPGVRGIIIVNIGAVNIVLRRAHPIRIGYAVAAAK